MHQQEINRINEIVQELNLLLPIIAETHIVSIGLAVQDQSVRRLDIAMIERENENN